MKSLKAISVVIEPAMGGQLATRPSSERAGHVHYSRKRDWRRELDVEVRREGHDYFYPMVNIPIGNQPFPQNQPTQPATSLPINLIHEVRHGNGDLAVCSGTETDLYVLFPWENSFPYFEPGATPDDDYIEPGDGRIIPPSDTDTEPTYPTPDESGYYSGGNLAGPTTGPVPIPIPVTPPGTPEPDPDTTPIPNGNGWPNVFGHPTVNPPPGFEEVDVCTDYVFWIRSDDPTGQNFIDAMETLEGGLGYIQALGVLLLNQMTKVMEQYKQMGYTNIGRPSSGGTWWTVDMAQRPLDALRKIGDYIKETNTFDGGDPTLNPDSGIGDRYMGPVGESIPTLKLCGYFLAIPPAS